MVLAPFREEESPSANAVVSELVSEREREREGARERVDGVGVLARSGQERISRQKIVQT
jgi:hypothetical protein